MTKVTFYRCGESFLGFKAGGHAGNAPAGENIVCAAISTAVGLTECQLTDVLRLEPDVTIDEENAAVRVMFKTPDEAAQPALRALNVYLKSLAGEYPRYLKISEE